MHDTSSTAGADVSTGDHAPPPSGRLDVAAVLCDGACLVFASWTLLAHLVTWSGGNATSLAWAAGGALVVGGVVLTWFARRRRVPSWFGRIDDDMPEEVERPPAPVARIAFAALGLSLAVFFRLEGDLRLFCALALAYFAASYLVILTRPTTPAGGAGQAVSRSETWALLALGAAYALLALCAHVPDHDDTLYVNMAVSVADFPGRALLSTDTVQGIAGVPFKLVPYRLQSLELGVGLLNHLTGIPALYLFHLFVPAVAAFLVPLALARLMRAVDRRRALAAVSVVLLLVVFDGGGGPGSYHKFGFIRLFQGKAIFASMVLPALMAYGIRFGLRPTAGRFLMLAAAQVAALGTTVTALWAAPAAAMLGVATPLRLRSSSLRPLLLALLSSAYLLAWGLYLKLHVYAVEPSDAAGLVDAIAASVPTEAGGRADRVTRAYNMVLGHGTHLATALAVSLLAWPACRTALARRFAIVIPLGFYGLLGNPWLAGLVSSVTTSPIYWRVVWLLPVPLLGALLLTSLLRPGLGLSVRTGVVLFVLATGVFVGWQSLKRPTLLRAGLSVPRPKLDPRSYKVARALLRVVGPKRQVIAPLRVSMVLPMLNGYCYPLVTKPRFVPYAERAGRVQLNRIVEQSGSRLDAAWFARRLDDYHVKGVALYQGKQQRRLGRALSDAGFRVAATVENHEIWTR